MNEFQMECSRILIFSLIVLAKSHEVHLSSSQLVAGKKSSSCQKLMLGAFRATCETLGGLVW